jgi:hypothetical protein
MAVTLNEVAKLTDKPLGKAVILNLLRQSPLMQMLPIDSVDALQVTTTRWQTLPPTGTRSLNGAYTESTGQTEQVVDTLFIYGGDIKVDRVMLKIKTIENPLQVQTKMKVASLGSKINDHFINNDHATGDTDGFEGLKKRIANQPARMTIDLAAAGDSLKVLANATNEHAFVDALHRALKVVGVTAGHSPGSVNVAMFMNETSWLGVGMVLRRLTLLSQTTDAYDRVWTAFGPAKLVDVGLKNDQATEIITDTEDPGDAGNDSSSIYVVRFGGIPVKDASGKTSVVDDDGVKLLQVRGTSPDPYDPLVGGEGGAGAAPQLVRRIDWPIGLVQKGSYSACRIKGFKMAAS